MHNKPPSTSPAFLISTPILQHTSNRAGAWLSTGRSANAIRKRWTKLEEDAAALEPVSDERVKIWNRKTERSHAGSAAPLRANLAKYLRDHPDCEVYNGQDDEDGPPPKANAVSPHCCPGCCSGSGSGSTVAASIRPDATDVNRLGCRRWRSGASSRLWTTPTAGMRPRSCCGPSTT